MLSMETSTFAICRTCLGHTQSPRNLCNNVNKTLADTLRRLMGFSLVKPPEITFNICKKCEAKLFWITEFKDMCLNSFQNFCIAEIKSDKAVEEPEEKQFSNPMYGDHTYALDPIILEHSLYFDNVVKKEETENVVDSIEFVNTKPKSLKNKPKTLKTNHEKQKNTNNKIAETASTDKTHKDRANNKAIQKNRDSIKANKDVQKNRDHVKDYNEILPKITNTTYYNTQISKEEWIPPLHMDKIRNQIITKQYVNRRLHPEQFPDTEVLQAIDEIKRENLQAQYSQCNHCDKVYATQSGLGNHMYLTHGHLYKFWCQRCNSITNDIRVHRQQCAAFLCKFCHKKYTGPVGLIKHMKYHCTDLLLIDEEELPRDVPDLVDVTVPSPSGSLLETGNLLALLNSPPYYDYQDVSDAVDPLLETVGEEYVYDDFIEKKSANSLQDALHEEIQIKSEPLSDHEDFKSNIPPLKRRPSFPQETSISKKATAANSMFSSFKLPPKPQRRQYTNKKIPKLPKRGVQKKCWKIVEDNGRIVDLPTI